MSIKTKFLLVAVGLCLVSSNFLYALSNKAEDSLSKGKRLYADGRYEEAMDNFIDVFVTGNPDQIAEANEYVNLIHFDRGGVVTPKQVPYNKEIEDRQNIGVQGKKLFEKETPKEAPQAKENAQPALKEIFNQEKEEADVPEPPASVPEADPFAKPEIVAQAPAQQDVKTEENTKDAKPQKQPKTPKGATKQDAQTPAVSDGKTGTVVPAVAVAKAGTDENKNQPVAEKEEKNKSEQQAEDKNAAAENEAAKPEVAPVAVPQETIIAEEDTFPKGSKAKVRALQAKKEEEKRQQMRDDVIAKLKKNKDVQVYMRDGRVDALDIPSDVLFSGKAINKNASGILDGLYSLMILENAPAYYVLPEGSYTDEVTIQGVRQAVTLNSYLVNRGISPAKMNLNMGLSTQEPPEKFKNLAGVSVVFDYDGKARLKSKLETNNMLPILSLAVYPFEEITPALDEVFVIDFSVVETSAPIKEWSLQIVSHDIDGHFYVVKQFSGKNALAHQVFWNGKKRYFGQILPTGDYTIVLRAVDTEKRERIVKRKVTIKDAPKKLEKEFVKTEDEVVKAEKQKDKGQAALDYNQKRLWNKPNKKNMGGTVKETEQTPAQNPQAEIKDDANAAGSAVQENKQENKEEAKDTKAADSYEDSDDYDFGE